MQRTLAASLLLLLTLLAATSGASEPAARLVIDASASGKPISGDLFGIFFEDINYAADGGLYAELVQNRSFEFETTAQTAWTPLAYWEFVGRGGGAGSLVLDAARPLHPDNPRYAVVDVRRGGDGAGIRNPGFDGIAVKKGATYDFSTFVRQLYVERRWGGRPIEPDDEFTLLVRLEDNQGESVGDTELSYRGSDWQRVEGEIVAERTVDDARLWVYVKQPGGIALDMVSLFPRDTFMGRKNGLRKDLAETLAAPKPRFIRFPGGCLVHGNGLPNMYRWKDTIGPIHERRGQANIWGYHQSVGLGYFEYFQFCEDIGAKPLPVVPAAVSCQNSGHTAGVGQEGIPLDDMPEYIQEVLDLVEWANGPADSEWGAKRAAAGHPEPFGLEYLGVGNEDRITPVFEERFRMIYAALQEKHPEITVIGTVGPFPDGEDFDQGWRIASELNVPMVDEHYYRPPEWFLDNLHRYDSYNRARSKVYLGEYAAHERNRRTTLRSALAEAAYMTHLERNGDVVHLASYAPLLGKRGRTQWNPDLIYFTNTGVFPTINYYVQRMFGQNSGDELLAAKVTVAEADETSGDSDVPGSLSLAVSVVRDKESGDVIAKIVNFGDQPRRLQVELAGAETLAAEGALQVLTGDPNAVNDFDTTEPVEPATSRLAVGPQFDYESPAHSLTVIRIKPR